MKLTGGHTLRSRPISRIARAALPLVLVVGLVACGGDSEEASDQDTAPAQQDTASQEEPAAAEGSGDSDACSLLTADEVAAAGIAAATANPVEDDTGAKSCNYSGDDPFQGVTVLGFPGGGQNYYDQLLELSTDAEPLPGLGDQAVISATNEQQVTVLVIRGDDVLTVGGSITAENAESLARKAL